MSLPHRSSTTPSSTTPSGSSCCRERLATHVGRPLAGSGIRRLRLRCTVDGVPAVPIELLQAWQVDRATCSSIVCVGDDGPLAGTTVLLGEQPFRPASLWLSLRTAERVRALEPFRIEDRVLGSDFVYDDFRFWTPRVLAGATHCETTRDGALAFSGTGCWRGEPIVARATLDAASGVLVTASWTRPDEPGPFRLLTASGIRRVGGVVTAARMRIACPHDGYESSMELACQATGVMLPTTLFTTEGLREASAELAAIAATALA